MHADPLGTTLATPPPVLALDKAAALLTRHYGITGDLDPLPSERDLNFRVTTPERRFVLKIANPSEAALVTDFQTAALLHLQPTDLPVPRVIRSLTGQTLLDLPEGRTRLLTYVEGQPMHLTANSAARTANMGRLAARLSLGLHSFQHPGSGHELLWDIKHTSRLRPLLPLIADDLRPLATECLNRFDRDVAPHLGQCRAQVVHNDLNQHNLLVSPDDPTLPVGVLDFGDMVLTPLICDAAVTICYQLDPAAPRDSLTTFARAYHAVLPLTPLEIRLLPDLTLARQLTSLAIASARAVRYPDNAPYILRNMKAAVTGLVALANAPRAPLEIT